MSEKSKNGWRKVQDGISLGIAFIPILLLGVVFVTVTLAIVAVVTGAIFRVCWNTAMTTMFGFSKVTMFQAFVLAYTIGVLLELITITVQNRNMKNLRRKKSLKNSKTKKSQRLYLYCSL